MGTSLDVARSSVSTMGVNVAKGRMPTPCGPTVNCSRPLKCGLAEHVAWSKKSDRQSRHALWSTKPLAATRDASLYQDRHLAHIREALINLDTHALMLLETSISVSFTHVPLKNAKKYIRTDLSFRYSDCT